jgi:replicative DNA helicase
MLEFGDVEKLLPQNVEAECGVLGSIIIDPEAIIQVADFLQPEDFYRDAHRTIYETILQLYDQHEPADFITICDELERRNKLESVGGAAYITSLINQVPTSGNVEYYGHIVERTAILRRLIHAAGEIAAVAYDEVDANVAMDRAEQLIFGISQRQTRSGFSSLSEILTDYMVKLDQLHERRGSVVGVPTGFTDLDRLTGGLQKSDLIILAARPSIGKTSLALSVAHNTAAKFKHSVAVFSLEMSKEQLVQRLLSMDAGIDQQRLRTGWIEDDEWERIILAMEHLSEASIWIDDTAGISTMEVRSKARRLQAEHGIDLIIVDYLQLMQATIGGKRNENRVQEVSEISRSLKGLARELDVPILALAQLSRTVESRQSKVPQLSDLRESGCLAGDTLVYLPDTGTYERIDSLVGKNGFRVLALNEQTWKLEPSLVTNAFATGCKPVYKLTTRLGRSVRATANHKFLTIHGWKRLDEIRAIKPLEAPIDRAHADVSRWHGVSTIANEELPASGDGSMGTICTINRRAHDQSAPMELIPNWDNIVSIEPDGEAEVYDLTVDLYHNFTANEVIAHNSIEQDADVVMFIYRDDVYNPETDRKNIADIIVAKHRNGPVGEVSLFFQSSQTRFCDLEVTPPVEE